MKKQFIIIAAALLALSSCKKKAPGTNCWAVLVYDSVYSTNTSDIQHYKQAGILRICNQTQEMINDYVKAHPPTVDTLVNIPDSILEVQFSYEAAQIW